MKKGVGTPKHQKRKKYCIGGLLNLAKFEVFSCDHKRDNAHKVRRRLVPIRALSVISC